MPYYHFPISPGPTPPPAPRIPILPATLAHLSQSPQPGGSVVTVHNVNHDDHVTMPVTVVTVNQFPCCNAPMHIVIHFVQLPKKEATVTIVPPHARGG